MNVSMIEFMSKKKSLVIYTMFLIVLIYGLKIANTSYGMDTNWFIQNPSGYMNYWISIGRFGEVILKNIFERVHQYIYDKYLNLYTFRDNFIIFNLSF